MPEHSPSENVSFLEPSGNAYELAVTTDERIDLELREALGEDETGGFIKKKLGVGFWICTGWFLFVATLAFLAPVLPIPDPNAIQSKRFLGPSAAHWLGTDDLGRDVFARLVWGARVSLIVGFASILLGLLIGTIIGLLAGYLKGWVDSVFMSAMDVILAFPALLLALSIIGFSSSAETGAGSDNGRDLAHISLAIGIVAIPAIARLVRANTLSFREREFVLASRTLGASHVRVLTREILPNVVPPVVSFAVIGVAVAITAEASLAFVGVSVPLPTATWGGMINAGKDHLLDQPQLVFIPCTVLVVTVMAFYFAGDRLRQFFDVKESML